MIFNFTKDKKIILYGWNSYTEKLLVLLEEKIFNVVAVIDKRANELKQIHQIPVYKMESHPFLKEEEKDTFVVIIMLQNALQHDLIATDFFNQGFQNIIFVPMNGKMKEQKSNQLRNFYNLLLEYQIDKLVNIPMVENKIFKNYYSKENSVLRDEGNWVVTWLPMELIYTNPKDVASKEKQISQYADIPLITYKPYVDLFFMFLGRTVEAEEYLQDYGMKSCKYTNSFNNSDISMQRFQLFHVYERELNKGMNFFISSAPQVRFNEKGYFNLLEGQHRAVYLWAKGLRQVPVRIKKTDFELWSNTTIAKKVIPLLKKGKELDIKTPISNPYFKLMQNDFQYTAELLLDMFQRFRGRFKLTNEMVVDCSIYQGYFGRNAYRMDAKEVWIKENDNFEFLNQINQVLFTLGEKIHIFNQEQISCDKSIVVIGFGLEFCKESKDYNQNKLEELLLLFNQNSCKEFYFDFNISMNRPEIHKIFLNMKYKKLGTFFQIDHMREVGVFYA